MQNIMEKLHKTISESKVVVCRGCKNEITFSDMEKAKFICSKCGKYNRMPPRQRIESVCDKGSFSEIAEGLKSVDFLNFPGYKEKLIKAKDSTGEEEAVICGTAKIGSIECAIFVMDARFIMASMGSVVGEKVTRLFETATEKNLPVIAFTASGGARMQEGITSLMQMAKTSAAAKRHSEKGLLYITVLTDPTTGGVTASFAMEGDIILAEPDTLVGFAGRRVIEQTTGTELPDNFQKSEFLRQHGFIDAIVERKDMKKTLETLLDMHKTGASK